MDTSAPAMAKVDDASSLRILRCDASPLELTTQSKLSEFAHRCFGTDVFKKALCFIR